MKINNSKNSVEALLVLAGIKINGVNPWDVRVHNDKFYRRVLSLGSLGLGEAYMDGWWDCERLDEFFFRVLREDLSKKIRLDWRTLLEIALAKIVNRQSKKRAFHVGERHYDLGNDLYEAMLDKRMIYSCAYWKDAQTLDEAQEAKLDLICRKIGLEPGMEILDIGCGWAGFAKYAAEKYRVEVTGVTVSKEQEEFGKNLCKGLPVKIRLQDYREVNGNYDRIVSVGMFEHVGYKNYKNFMNVANRCLRNGGLFLLQTNGMNESVTSTDLWLNKYIFPNSMLPSIKQLGKACEELFIVEDLHNLSSHYDKTLLVWHQNFEKNWDKIKSNYNERFYRMWKYYLLMCAGAFRARKNQLWQIVLSKKSVVGGYYSIR